MRRPGAELVEQRGLVGLGGGEMAHLHMPEAADLLRDRREADREVMVLGRELAEHLVEHRFIVADELALGAALLGAAERIEAGAAQELELREQAEGAQHPRAEGHLARLACGGIAPRQQRRREMERE